jgi:transcriptional regulator PpsR
MVSNGIARADITLTMDFEGVIRQAVSSEALSDEKLEVWQGVPWRDTIDPSIAKQVAQSIEDIRRTGVSSCFQVKQRFPSGREVPIEYTTISLGKSSGFIAVGRNIQTISDLQSRLALAQEARERDYWKIREMETRYRLLFDATNEAVLLVRVTNLQIVEANLNATNLLGLLPGSEIFSDLQPRDRKSFQTLLEKVREHGRAPGIVLHLGLEGGPWSLRASLVNSEAGSFYLFQMTSMGGSTPIAAPKHAPLTENLVLRLPEGFVVIDRDGAVQRANDAFLDLVQIGTESAVLGQNTKRWLSQPGADVSVLLSLVQRHGSVRLMSATMYGELGSSAEVEISAAGNQDEDPEYIGLLIRDVTSRLTTRIDRSALSDADAETSGNMSLEHRVKEATESVERQSIAAALEKSNNNRTVAAKMLGLSRQSLHTKLNKYGLGEK